MAQPDFNQALPDEAWEAENLNSNRVINAQDNEDAIHAGNSNQNNEDKSVNQENDNPDPHNARTEAPGNRGIGDNFVNNFEETRSGRVVNPPARLIKTIQYAQVEELNEQAEKYTIGLTSAENKYYKSMKELSKYTMIGAGLGGGFMNTNELHVMKYDQAMEQQDASKWQNAVDGEHY